MMIPSRRRNKTSLLESSTIITANLIMASSSYLLARFNPQVPAVEEPEPSAQVAATASTTMWPSAAHTRSMDPMAGCKTAFMEPEDDGEDGKVDEEAEMFIKRFRERTQSEAARRDAAATAASTAAVRPPQPPVAATKWARTVHRYQR
jgi:hypothetical protein